MENTKKNYMIGLCKANNYGGMTGLVKCRGITEQLYAPWLRLGY